MSSSSNTKHRSTSGAVLEERWFPPHQQPAERLLVAEHLVFVGGAGTVQLTLMPLVAAFHLFFLLA